LNQTAVVELLDSVFLGAESTLQQCQILFEIDPVVDIRLLANAGVRLVVVLHEDLELTAKGAVFVHLLDASGQVLCFDNSVAVEIE